MAQIGYYEQDLLERCKPRLIRNLIGHKARDRARQIMQWMNPLNDNYLILSGYEGSSRHIVAEVASIESGRVCIRVSLASCPTARSVAIDIRWLRRTYHEEHPGSESSQFVYVIDQCENFPREQLQLLHNSIHDLCLMTPVIFVVDFQSVDDFLDALPNSHHIHVACPRQILVERYLKAVSFMEGRIPIPGFYDFFVSRNRNIDLMLRDIRQWTKVRPKKLVAHYISTGRAVRDSTRALQEVGGRSKRKITKDVSMVVADVKELKAGTAKAIKEAKSKGTPIVTMEVFNNYISMIKKILGQEPMMMKEWQQAINEILQRHQLLDENNGNWFRSDILSSSRKYKPDKRHSILVINDNDFLYYKMFYYHTRLCDVLPYSPIYHEQTNYASVPQAELYDCYTKKFSIIMLLHPTKEAVMSGLRKFFQLKSTNKYVLYLGKTSRDGNWELPDRDRTVITGLEVEEMLRRTTVPRLGGNNRLKIYPGRDLNWRKLNFANANMSEVLVPSLVKVGWSWKMPSDFLGNILRFMMSKKYMRSSPRQGKVKIRR